jgi:hypothetical protein
MNEATRLLQWRSSDVSVEFDFSASHNLTAPSSPSLFAVLRENQMKDEYVTVEIE